MTMRSYGIIFLLTLTVLCVSNRALSLTCAGGIVSLGETIAEVHIKCKDPTIWDQRIEESDRRDDEGHWIHLSRTIDEWTYDFGSNRLIQTLIFKNGDLIKVSSGGYGKGATNSASDRPGIISVGDSKSKVILKWGQPTYLEQRQEERSSYSSKGEGLQKTVTIERLTYDFGPDRFIRILTFENSKLINIRTGSYGKGRPAGSEEGSTDEPQN
jgi:hypothetical protein